MPKVDPAPAYNTVNFDINVTIGAANVAKDKWEDVVRHHFLTLFHLFGDRFCKFCPVVDADDADTFVSNIAAPGAN